MTEVQTAEEGGEAPQCEAASCADGDYAVNIEKTPDTTVGIDLAEDCRIATIEEGLVSDWNNSNPEAQVRIGDRILEINAIRGDVRQINAELQKDGMLQMKLRRNATDESKATPSSASNAPPEKSSYQSFLENFRHVSAQAIVNEVRDFVTDFPSDLTRLQAAYRVHDFLSVTTKKLVSSAAFDGSKLDEVGDHLERFVLNKLHKVLFRKDDRQNMLADLRLEEKQKASAGLESLGSDLSEESREQFKQAVDCLKQVNQFSLPGSKVICMLNAHRLIDNVVDELRWRGEAAANHPDSRDGDEGYDEAALLGKVMVALVIEASPPNLFTNVEFAASFRHPPRTTEEERSCLRDFSTALGVATGLTPKVPRLAIGAGGSWTWGGFEDVPAWLDGTGVSFRFESAEAGNLLISEVDDLLSTYHRMASVLRLLAENPPEPA